MIASGTAAMHRGVGPDGCNGMGLDYTAGCANFRDVGAFVNLIANEELVPERRLLRGGKIDHVREAAEIGNPGTVINLRGAPDPEAFGAALFHFPTANTHEKYDTSNQEVRRWLNDVVSLFEADDLRYPVLIHCLSGKDRTGVVVAALLRILGVPDGVIVEEYLLSEGGTSEAGIRRALAGIGDPEIYFRRVDLQKVRRQVRGGATVHQAGGW